jgi:hypothetical protein
MHNERYPGGRRSDVRPPARIPNLPETEEKEEQAMLNQPMFDGEAAVPTTYARAHSSPDLPNGSGGDAPVDVWPPDPEEYVALTHVTEYDPDDVMDHDDLAWLATVDEAAFDFAPEPPTLPDRPAVPAPGLGGGATNGRDAAPLFTDADMQRLMEAARLAFEKVALKESFDARSSTRRRASRCRRRPAATIAPKPAAAAPASSR